MPLKILMSLIVACFCFFGCGEQKAEELFEVAKLEELQNSPDHARQLYQEILTQYPDSSYAPKAKERLKALKK